DTVLAALTDALAASTNHPWTATPLLADSPATGTPTPISNPTDQADIVGTAQFAAPDLAARAFAAATPGCAPTADRPPILRAAADGLEAQMPALLGLIIREAGKSASNAIAEVREAVDFLRYYADQGDALGTHAPPLGTVVCISPWNFPLSIFT